MVKTTGASLLFATLLFLASRGPLTSDPRLSKEGLTVYEEPERVVLFWNGPVVAPMRDKIALAMDRLRQDQRQIVIAMNSPGGSVEHGREVMSAIRSVAKTRRINTTVVKGGICASMCVPIYLLGRERTADPDSQFMFHEASIDLSRTPESRSEAAAATRAFGPALMHNVIKQAEKRATDELYGFDMRGARVNARWVVKLREKIAGRDVWMSARELVEQDSGVVDALAE